MSEEADQNGRPARGGKRAMLARGAVGGASRLVRLSVAILAGCVTLALVATLALYLRLNAGPIDVSRFVPHIVEAMSGRMQGAGVSVGSARIGLGEDGGATLAIADVALLNGDGTPFARIPEATGEFSIWDALRGRLNPSDVTLTGVSGRLERDEEGRFSFGFGGLDGGESGDGVAPFRRLLAAATEDASSEAGAAPADEGDAEALSAKGQLFRLQDASIVYLDRFSGRVFRARDADLSFWRARSGTFGGGEVTLDGGRYGEVKVQMTGRRTESGHISMRASFDNAAPRDIATQIVALDWLAAFDAPVSGEMDLAMDAEGDLTALSGGFEAGAGRLSLGGGVTEPLRAARLEYVFEPEFERFVIEEVSVDADRTTAHGAGFVEVNRDEAGAPSDVVVQLEFDDLHVAAPELLDAPLHYEAARVTGRVTLDPFLIEIGELRLAGEALRLGAAGRIWRADEEWRADLTAEASNLALEDFIAHWPRQAAPGALEWMKANMVAAHIIDADAALRLGGDDEEVKIDFTFDDTSGFYLRPMTPIENAVGSGQVDLKRFSLALDAGSVTPPGGEPLDLAGSTFVIADLDHPATPGEATILAAGRTADALALLDQQPLALVSALGVPLGPVEGTAKVRAVASLPLLKDLLLEDVKADASAVFADLALTAPGLDRRVTAKTVEMTADTSQFALSGDVVVSGVPASVSWTEVFSPSTRAIRASARLTPKRLAAFGIEQDILTDGVVPVRVDLVPGGNGASFDISADLTGAALASDVIGWRKAEGREASLKARGVIDGARLEVSAFDLASPDLIVAGSFGTDDQGAPSWFKTPRLQYRGGVDLALSGELKGKRWVVDARGAMLDFTRFDDLMERAKDSGAVGEGGADPRFRFVLDIDEVRATETQFFRNVKGVFARSKKRGLWTELEGSVLGGARASFRFERTPEGGDLTLRADDAGRILRDAGVFDDGAGGKVEITAKFEDGPGLALSGHVKVDDIVVHEDAKLQQMLAGADLAELRREMRDDGINFDKIRAPFRYDGETLRIKDATARGGQIGVTLSGDYDVEKGELDFDGVFTPLYQINSALGKIPLLGDLLTGGKGQGVFAFNFAVRGDAEDPDVSVNPLSVLTPGILRRIFSADASQEVRIGDRDDDILSDR